MKTTKSDRRSSAAPAEERTRCAERWARLTAADVMKTDVVTIPDSAPFSEVERILSDERISGAPVVTAKGDIVGVISWRDVVDRETEDEDARPRRGGFFHVPAYGLTDEDLVVWEMPEESEELAKDVMTSEVYAVAPEDGLREIAAVMTKHEIHRVLVLEDGKLRGIVATQDVVRALAG